MFSQLKGRFLKHFKLKPFTPSIEAHFRELYHAFSWSDSLSERVLILISIFEHISDSLTYFGICETVGADQILPYLIYSIFVSLPLNFPSSFNSVLAWSKQQRRNDLSGYVLTNFLIAIKSFNDWSVLLGAPQDENYRESANELLNTQVQLNFPRLIGLKEERED